MLLTVQHHPTNVLCNRYNPHKGLLTLVSEKYSVSEENRRHIMEMLVQLVSEGHKAFPAPDAQLATEQQPEQQAA